MALDKMNNAMPPQELKELNEKNLEGRIERIWISKKNEEMQNSTSGENGELIALRDVRRKDTWTPPTKNLDELLKNELNHEEPPWRIPVTKRWWDRMKDERIRIKLEMI